MKSIIKAESLGRKGAAASAAVVALDLASIAFAGKEALFPPLKGLGCVRFTIISWAKRRGETHDFCFWGEGRRPEASLSTSLFGEYYNFFSFFDPIGGVSVLVGGPGAVITLLSKSSANRVAVLGIIGPGSTAQGS